MARKKAAESGGKEAAKKPAAKTGVKAKAKPAATWVKSAVKAPAAKRSPKEKKAPEDFVTDKHPAKPPRTPHYIVGMGGSAGSLDAFEHFFKNMPFDSGLSFVLVPHLDPTHKGIMPELIQRNTKMEVHQAEDGMRVRPNNVYVIPSNRDMSIFHGKIQLMEPTAPRGLRLPIDFFLRNLAEDQKERAVCVILSGMGTDGTLGLKAVKEQGGVSMVQDPASSQFDGMPRSAMDTGMVDVTAPPDQLASRLLEFIKHSAVVREQRPTREDKRQNAIQKIFILLRNRTGHDFSFYKKNTILRRVERRMSVHQIDSIEHYVRYLQENAQEVDFLFKELLIGVTNFFRDPEAFEALKEKALTKLLQGKRKGTVLRVWVPGCSTGEEAYSLVMVITEALEALKLTGEFQIQVFATDIDKDAIDKARQGIYQSNIAADVSAERLSRFFHKEDNFYRIKKEIREQVVLAEQDIIIDPPFTKLDIVCCRNLLIYFNAELQKKLIPLFHYTLAKDGVLFLGSSETVGGFADLFLPLDGKWKIFQRRETSPILAVPIDLPSSLLTTPTAEAAKPSGKLPREIPGSIPEITQKLIIDSYAPPSILINGGGDIIYISGRTGRYLELSTGKASMNVFPLARQGLGIELASAVRKALHQKSEVVIKGLQVKTNGSVHVFDLTVLPIQEPEFMRDLLLIVFREVPQAKPAGKGKSEAADRRSPVVGEMEKEIKYLRETLQTTTEEMETSQEELKSANEELQSSNEELQSTNEELTTSKEEFQSLNEELITVNSELQTKIEELTQSNNDMRNLLNSTEIATIFLDNEMNVKRFTSQATRIVNLIQSDVGRPFSHLVSNLSYEGLDRDVKEVLETLVFKEVQVKSKGGHFFNMRIMPYRTTENVIDGVVLTFVDITAMKKLEEELRVLVSICESSGDAIIAFNLDGTIFSWNGGAELLYGYQQQEMLGRQVSILTPPGGRKEMAEVIKKVRRGAEIEPREAKRVKKDGSTARVVMSFAPIRDTSGNLTGISTIDREIREKKE